MNRITILIAALGFGAGWLVNGWRHDALELVAQKAAKARPFKRRKKAPPSPRR